MSYEDFREKGYYVVPPPGDDYKPTVSNRWFYEGRPCDIPDPTNPRFGKKGLGTYSGKIEFVSRSLQQHFPDDEERPPVPRWIPEGVTHQESRQSKRAGTYPLLLVSNHPRWRTHAEHDDVTWLSEIKTCKVKGADGYMYEPVWINTVDAGSRDIENGDIVKMYNERGIVLGGAYVTERIIPGAVSQDHGARIDLITSGLDRGGSNNLICPANTTSRNAYGIASSGFLVEVEKVSSAEMKMWKTKYPEAFGREYDAASGLHSNAWIEP